jgi:hypothetical protein
MSVPGSTPYVNSFGQTTSFIQNVASNSYAISGVTSGFGNMYGTMLSKVQEVYDQLPTSISGDGYFAIAPTAYNAQRFAGHITPVYANIEPPVYAIVDWDVFGNPIEEAIPPVVAYYVVTIPLARTLDSSPQSFGLPADAAAALDQFIQSLSPVPNSLAALTVAFNAYLSSLVSTIGIYTPPPLNAGDAGATDEGAELLQLFSGAGAGNRASNGRVNGPLNGNLQPINPNQTGEQDLGMSDAEVYFGNSVQGYDVQGGSIRYPDGSIQTGWEGQDYPLLFNPLNPFVYTGAGTPIVSNPNANDMSTSVYGVSTSNSIIFPPPTITSAQLAASLTADYSGNLNANISPSDYSNVGFSAASESLAWFNSFLATANAGITTAGVSSFFGAMNSSLTTTAAIQGNTRAQLASAIPNAADLLLYQSIFLALFPSGVDPSSGKVFTNVVFDYRNTMIAQKGYFNPSQDFAGFVNNLKVTYEAAHPLFQTLPTSLAPMRADKVMIILDIYKIISQLLNTVQEVAQAQAARLLILSQWQKAYTTLQAQIPVFRAGFPANPNGADINNLNATTNANFRTLVQTNQAAVADDIKTLQSNLNQSNDAMSQQANFSTSLIQEMSTILSAIFR